MPNNLDTQPVDTDGSVFGNLPADGLSKNSYNVAAFYEKGPWQIRLAYNWRSEYLISQADCCIKLPIWQEAYVNLRFSLATSYAWILGSLLIGFTYLQLRILRRVDFRQAKGE